MLGKGGGGKLGGGKVPLWKRAQRLASGGSCGGQAAAHATCQCAALRVKAMLANLRAGNGGC